MERVPPSPNPSLLPELPCTAPADRFSTESVGLCREVFVCVWSRFFFCYFHRPYEIIPPIKCDSRTLSSLGTSPNDKNFPARPPPMAQQIWFAVLYGGGHAGKFWEGQGGLEGRGPSAKEGPLRLQGLPYPLNTNPILNFRSFSIFLETLSASSTVRVRSEARRVTRSATDFLPSPTWGPR